jgi:hypothetical protein
MAVVGEMMAFFGILFCALVTRSVASDKLIAFLFVLVQLVFICVKVEIVLTENTQ